ncbi:hypothetical protein LEP1GSC196_1895 [Leptospira meyeri serovar Semaranga str. Veldrot Semarang 173]|nr:hypothetical protein LEP1GSC196_1895 [Leptospira meyeri serovar Semaranga str. Veldrot Semarang 173]
MFWAGVPICGVTEDTTGGEVKRDARGSSLEEVLHEKLFPSTSENPIVYKILLMTVASIIGKTKPISFLFFHSEEIL